MNLKNDSLKENLEFYTEIPSPTPGPSCISLTLAKDSRSFHDPGLPVKFYNLFDALIDPVELIYANMKNKKEEENTFLRKSENITTDYFKRQEKRSEQILENRLKEKRLEEDYSDYYKQSFLDINQIEFDKDAKVMNLIPTDEKVDLYCIEHGIGSEVDMNEYFLIEITDEAKIKEIGRCVNRKK